MSLRRPIWFYKAGKRPWDKDFRMNIILLKLSPRHNNLTIRKEGIRVTWLKLNNKTYIFFIENFIKLYLIFINLIHSFHHNCLISQQNWLYIKRKNLCHQEWQQSNENLACFIDIIVFDINWNWEMVYEKQWSNKSITAMRQNCSKFTIQHKTFTLHQKTWKQITPS